MKSNSDFVLNYEMFSHEIFYFFNWIVLYFREHRGRDHIVVGFPTNHVYHHWGCESESRSGNVYLIQHCVIKFVSDLRQVSGRLRVLHQYNWPPQYNWNIVESGVKHHNPNLNPNRIIFHLSYTDNTIIVLDCISNIAGV